MTIEIYIADGSPPCHAVLMTANYLGIKLKHKKIDVLAGEQFKPEFLKINPLHTVPAIDDQGLCLAESRAIQAYLVNKYAPDSLIYPKDPKDRAIVDKMLYFDIGTLYKSLGDYLFPLFESQPLDPEKNETFKKALTLLEGFLSSTPYVAGDHVTIADYSIMAGLTFAEACEYNYDDYPNITAWLKKMKSEVSSYSMIEKSLEVIKEFMKHQKSS